MTEDQSGKYQMSEKDRISVGVLLMLMWFFLCLTLLPGVGLAGTYTSTKHGTDADRGVVDGDFPYTTKGLCAHCHDQHASIDGAEPTPPILAC